MSNQTEAVVQTSVAFFRLVFSPLFPFLMISTWATANVLVWVFRQPQFGFWVLLPQLFFKYAEAHLWAMIALVLFCLAALPLAWIALREWRATASGTLGTWAVVAVLVAGLIWLNQAWPANGSVFQALIFGIALLLAVGAVVDALVATLKTALQFRPQPGREVVEAQKAHGDARIAEEDEALFQLRSKR